MSLKKEIKMKNNFVKENFKKMIKKNNYEEKTENRVFDITNYIIESKIKNVVLGVSGGIDSAFVLELLLKAKEKEDFTIHTVFFTHYLHNNEASKEKVDNYIKNKDVNHNVINMKSIIEATNSVNEASVFVNTQYAYALMYTLLFRIAQKNNGITFGTTNKDEFGIGWFGKTSDMVVDVQPIHDFHKFEIYNSPLIKNINYEIVKSSPNGDLLSGKSDEEVFGCSYNEISSILNLKENNFNINNIMKDYKELDNLIKENNHKLKKEKNEFNPIFL